MQLIPDGVEAIRPLPDPLIEVINEFTGRSANDAVTMVACDTATVHEDEDPEQAPDQPLKTEP